MAFSSAIFLFVFFPVVFAADRLMPGIRGKNAVLLAFSLVFYCFGDLAHLPLLLLSILINWGAGLLLCRLTENRARKLTVTLAAVLDIGLLAAYKYLGFLIGTLNGLFGLSLSVPAVSLPLGISFFTFTGLSYVIEVWRKPALASRDPVKTGLYIALFPNLLAGPILAWRQTAPQLESRTCSSEKTARGLRRFVLGMAKKLLVADLVGTMVDKLLAGGAMDARIAWLAAVGYAVQIYFDFSGYSDMALGLGNVFGFEFPENFDHPYTALDMTDFWKRWHISLTTWFRNYLYMPMVMSAPLRGLYRRWSGTYGRAKANKLAILIPSGVVWLLTGLWHGAAWSFVLWGLWHGLFCVLEGTGLIRTGVLKKSAGGRLLLRFYTLGVVLVGTVLFRAGSAAEAWRVLSAMVGGWRFTAAGTYLLQRSVTGLSLFCLVVGVLGSGKLVPWLRERTGRWGEPVSYGLSLLLLVLCVMSIAVNGFQPFIYAQF